MEQLHEADDPWAQVLSSLPGRLKPPRLPALTGSLDLDTESATTKPRSPPRSPPSSPLAHASHLSFPDPGPSSPLPPAAFCFSCRACDRALSPAWPGWRRWAWILAVVRCLPLTAILEAFGAFHINFFILDVEVVCAVFL